MNATNPRTSAQEALIKAFLSLLPTSLVLTDGVLLSLARFKRILHVDPLN